ncbi:MAG: FAD-binding oxidoreductase, partial [Pseudomonadota bacterium]
MDLSQLKSPTPEVISKFIDIVGPDHAITNPADQAPYMTEWRDRFVGKSPLVLKPASTQEVSRILALANHEHIAVVPQGGNTGLVGGQIPFETGTEIVISLSRLNQIRHIDPDGEHVVCDAGVTLAQAQEAAENVDRLFPLSLASEGTCQIGGNLATNAGGTAVLSYGNARQLTYGLEVVLADGSILSDLKPLKKDNTGYDLSGIFIGSEGTLGIITAATLKLFPKPLWFETAFVACPSLEAVGSLYQAMNRELAHALTAFEFLPHRAIQYLETHVEKARAPVQTTSPWYVLIEVSHLTAEPATSNIDTNGVTQLEGSLTTALENGTVVDAAIAASQTQRQDFWRLREMLSEVQKFE